MSQQGKKTPKRQSTGGATLKANYPEWKICSQCGAAFISQDFPKHTTCIRNEDLNYEIGYILREDLFGFFEEIGDHSCLQHLPTSEVSSIVLMHPRTIKRCQLSIGTLVCLKTLGPSCKAQSAVLTCWPCTHLSVTGVSLLSNRIIALDSTPGKPASISHFVPSSRVATAVKLEAIDSVNKELIPALENQFNLQFSLKYLRTGSIINLRYLGMNVSCIVRFLTTQSDLIDEFNSLSVKDLNDDGFCMILSNVDVSFLNFEEKDLPENVVKLEDIGGLSMVKNEMNKLLGRLKKKDSSKYTIRSVIFYGPPGCGKTMLAKALANEFNMSLVEVSGSELYSKFYGETEGRLRDKFEEAKRRAPSLLLFDNIDTLCSRQDDSNMSSDQERRVLATLINALDDLNSSETNSFLIATTNRLENLDPAIRGPRRLDRELEITVPNAEDRVNILEKKLRKMDCEITDAEIVLLGRATHGYVGSDIDALIAEGFLHARSRGGALCFSDLNASLRKVKPSALREVQIEVPNVRWSDVGGQEKLKEKLKQAVEWPIKHGDKLRKLGISSPKGLLMFGPPGCSKTLIAKALATESALNFIAIK
ncbi:hypothetical protein QYM36_004200, partial [Artemia franciscana]